VEERSVAAGPDFRDEADMMNRIEIRRRWRLEGEGMNFVGRGSHGLDLDSGVMWKRER
jgi:hypothetical protein